MEVGSTVFKAKSFSPFFFFPLQLIGGISALLLTTAHQSALPLSKPGMYRNIISDIRDTTKWPPASALSFHIYTLHLQYI